MKFRQFENGNYFPPVLPNGEFWAIAFGSTVRQLLFVLNDSGLYAEGIFYLWEEITGSSIENEGVIKILSNKYRNGGLCFYEGTSLFREQSGMIVNRIGGYSSDYCLLNRLSFEKHRIHDL